MSEIAVWDVQLKTSRSEPKCVYLRPNGRNECQTFELLTFLWQVRHSVKITNVEIESSYSSERRSFYEEGFNNMLITTYIKNIPT